MPALERVQISKVGKRLHFFATCMVALGTLISATWITAAEYPGAESERRDAGPGTVWERAVTIIVPLGTELMRVETRPRQTETKDPMSYLRAEVKRRRHSHR